METTSHEEFTAKEEEAWASFETAVNAVPRDRRSAPSLPDGWSVKDLLWHVGFWWEICAETFERTTAGGDPDTELGDTDEINARALAESQAMTLEDVEARMGLIRERMLSAWSLVPADPAAVETFVGETIDHYQDHVGPLRALTAGKP